MIRNYIIILIVILLSFPEIKAQSDYRDGYLLLSKTDTIYGKIENNDYYSNSQFCNFKKNDSAKVIRYYPNQISGYRFINGKNYISKDVVVDSIKSTLFIEYLVHGKLNFYFYRDSDKMNHYFASKDTFPIFELQYSIGYSVIDGKKMAYELTPYVGILNYYTSDCPALKGDISNLGRPDHKKLLSIAEKYQSLMCKDEKCIIYNKKMQGEIKLNVWSGSYISTPGSKFPIFGFNLLFQQPQLSERLFFGIGLAYEETAGIIINKFGIPISINYLNPSKGFSPMFSFEIDANSFGLIQSIKAGCKYQIKKVSFFLLGDLKTSVKAPLVYASALKLGIMFDLK